MTERRDPVDRALAHIRSCEYPGPARNQRIEEAIMKANPARIGNRRGAAYAAVGVLVIGGAVAAATKLYDHYAAQPVVAAPVDVERDAPVMPADAEPATPEFAEGDTSTAGS